MVVSSPFDITIRLEALNWGFLSPYLRSQTLVLPSLSKFAPPLSLVTLVQHAKSLSLSFFLFKDASPPHLGYTKTHSHPLSCSCSHSFPCFCLGHCNFQPFGFVNQNLWRNLVSTVSIDDLLPCLRSYTSLVGQGSILICFGKIYGICYPLIL